MKRTGFGIFLLPLLILSVGLIAGCGNPTGGGGGGGGGGTFTADIWVATTGNDITGTGTESKPYATIGKAMLVVLTGEVIGVKAGIYAENVTWTADSDNVTLRGTSKIGTVISGEAAGLCIDLSGSMHQNQIVTIEGLTMRNGRHVGSGEHGGALDVYQDNITVHIKDVIVASNEGALGGGIGVGGTNDVVIIEGSNIINNSSVHEGGGIYCTESSASLYLKNTVLSGNSGGDGGGAVYIDASMTMEACAVYNNEAVGNASPGGGGLYINNGFTHLFNCVIFNNKASGTGTGGGIIHQSGDLHIENSTLASNEATETYGGGIYAAAGTLVRNSILWGNIDANITTTEGRDIHYSTYVSGDFIYNDIEYINPDVWSETSNSEDEPHFAGHIPYDDPNDFALTTLSPPVVRRNASYLYAPHYDYKGVLRWESPADDISMGAFEKN
jgi:predicted outer membrane repeat protein